MKTLTLLSLIILCSCGKNELGGEKSAQAASCMTREEVRNLCYVDEMMKLGHDPQMDEWVKDQCKRIYPTEGCYHGLY